MTVSNYQAKVRRKIMELKLQKAKPLLVAFFSAVGISTSVDAAIITVNTADNADFSPTKTNLWLAIKIANTNGQASNTIRFAIPGPGPHYLITPQFYAPSSIPALGGGYPIITNHNLTIDGYSQPGAFPNTNTILGSNTAVLKIVIDSRAVNYTTDGDHPLTVGAETMDFALITGKTYEDATYGWPGFTSADAAQICIFQATNVSIKGLCFLNDSVPGASGLSVASIALGADYPTNWANPPLNGPSSWFYPEYALHVSGCWFNLLPDGTAVVDGGYNAVRVQRQRMQSNNGDFAGRWSPSGTTVGVAKNTPNDALAARAQFNIIMSQAQGTAIQGERTRYCGNFFNVFADGMHQYFPDPQTYVGDPPMDHPIPTSAFIGGSYAGRDVIGTDGDGVNDAEERNVFAGLPRKRANGCAQIDHQCGCWNIKVAGNYIGVAVDGVTRWTNSTSPFRFSNRPTCPTNCVFGSDFDGISDALEANVICNNWPLDYWFPNQATEPDLSFYFYHQLSPRYQLGAPPETLNNDKQGENGEGVAYQFANSFRGNKLINNFTAPLSPFACWRDDNSNPGYFPCYTNLITSTPFTLPRGTAEQGATNFITVVNPSSSTRRLKGTFPLGLAPYTHCYAPDNCVVIVNPFTNVIIDVYVANEEGLINGAKFQTLTNVLPVWAQGEKVLAYNLQADALGDLDPATGAFNFNISPYKIPAGTKVTVTASYAKAGVVGTYMAEMHTSRFSLPVALNAVSPITITSITNNGNSMVTIKWTGGDTPYILEQSTSLLPGSWVAISTNSATSATVAIGSKAFFRVQ
jgi:hypothetical protein